MGTRAANSPGWRPGPSPAAPTRSASISPAWARPSWAISNMAARSRAGSGDIADKLHLHARSIDIGRPDGGRLQVTAPLPPHMVKSWQLLGFDPDDRSDPFPAEKSQEEEMKRFYKEVSVAPCRGRLSRPAGRQAGQNARPATCWFCRPPSGRGHCRGMAGARRRDRSGFTMPLLRLPIP